MIDLPDKDWTPYATVIGIGELGVRVLLKLLEKQRDDLKLCAIVSDKTQIAGREHIFSTVFVGDVETLGQQSDLHHLIQNSVMFLGVADTNDVFSERMVSAITDAERNIVSFALLKTLDDNAGQSDYIHQTRAIYMTAEGLRSQCEIQPELFADEVDVVAEAAGAIATMPRHNLIGFAPVDMQEVLSRPGKLTAVFGQGNTPVEAVDDLLLALRSGGIDLKRCELAVFSMAGASNRLSVYDVNEAPDLMAKKMGRDMDSLSDNSMTLLSGPLDDSLGDALKILAIFCEKETGGSCF